MVYNNLINHLKLWCQNKGNSYEKSYNNYGGISYVGYHVTSELKFKLSTLIDKPFESKDELRREILNFIDIHYEHCLLHPLNNVAVRIVDKINNEFCEYLEIVLSDSYELASVDIPYMRIIVGKEAENLIEKFRTDWHYVKTSYWFPLMGDEPQEIQDKFFVMFDYLEPYFEELCKMIGLPDTHIYCYGETAFRPDHCIEMVELLEYGGLESIYTDKEFSWAIYFSHEDTVAFAGSIVPKVKELLIAEKEHWDKFEFDFFSEKQT